jgi:hypothetical protein
MDDIIGASVLYPEVGFSSGTGGLQGRVTNAGTAVFGAHVVVLDGEGNVIVSTLTEPDGSYQLAGLPPGTYSTYAEPLDGPVTETSIGGQFNSTVNVNFSTTFLGNTLDPAQRQTVQVTAGSVVQEINIAVVAAPASPLNITSPSLGVRVEQGSSLSFNVRGDGIASGIGFQVLSPALTLSSPVFSGGNAARLTIAAESASSVGVKTLLVQRSDATSALTGGLVVTGPAPAVFSVSPPSGNSSGGTRITVSGANFTAGSEVFLAGVPLADVSVLDATTLIGTTGANMPGSLTLLVVNPDGTSGSLGAAFGSSAAPPTVSSIDPSSGSPATTVKVNGTNFDTSISNVIVRFNGVVATVISATQNQIVAVVPFGASTGPISVTVFDQQTTGPVFTVTPPKPSNNHPETQFHYIDTSSGSGGSPIAFLNNNDDDAVQLSLPFDFTLFRSTFLAGTRLQVTTNGWLSFSLSPVEFQNGSLPGTTVSRPSGAAGMLPPNLIAAFFDDLILQRSDSGVSTRLLGTAPDRRWVVDWQNLSILDENNNVLDGRVSFQAILFEGSNDVAFQYRALEGARARGESATVGLQNATRNTAAQFSFNQASLTAGRVVIFRFNPNDGTYQVSASEVTQYIPLVIDTSRFRTNLGLTNISGAPAQASVTLYAATGIPIGSRMTTIPSGGLIQLNNIISFVRGLSPLEVNELSGSVVVSANQPLVTFGTQIDNTSDDPSLQLGKPAGSNALLIPSTTSVNQFRSSVVVQNVGGETAQVRLRLRDTAGAIRRDMVQSVEPYGFFSTDDLHASLGVAGIFGPLEITSLNAVPIVATSRVYSVNSGTSGFFEGQDVTGATTNGVVPISQDNASFRTNLGVNNIGDTVASVQLNLYDTSGSILGTTTFNIPARGLVQLDNVNRVLTGATGFTNTLGYIRIAANQPVLGYSTVIDNARDDPGLATSLTAGGTRLVVPSSTNVNQFRSTLTIINLSGNPAPVRLVVRNVNGNVQAQSDGITIPANGMFNLDDVLTSLGLVNSYGPIEIHSLNDLPLAAISRVYSVLDNTSGFFSAQPF